MIENEHALILLLAVVGNLFPDDDDVVVVHLSPVEMMMMYYATGFDSDSALCDAVDVMDHVDGEADRVLELI